jgi:dipeptidyl aminopeptidase/acylaminoacyl peptidase
VEGDRAVFNASSPTTFNALVLLEPGTGSTEVLRVASSARIDPDTISLPQPVEFPTTNGLTAYGLFYAPTNPGFRGPEGERPPLIVTSHGGPTSAAFGGLSVLTQLFTSRGFAMLDVDYGGSTGYGREYRKRLEGQWGVVDVDDCVNGALALAARGLVDPDRLAIRGGSASGYTTLCALTFRDEFKAGVSYFGIGDLVSFDAETHKFESRYTQSLVGPRPEAEALWRERSPLTYAHRIACPVLILQGLDDRIVPPVQAEQIVEGLRANRVPHAYLAFEGEDHGFRKAENIVRSFEAELSFYGQVFGFTPADEIDPVALVRA